MGTLTKKVMKEGIYMLTWLFPFISSTFHAISFGSYSWLGLALWCVMLVMLCGAVFCGCRLYGAIINRCMYKQRQVQRLKQRKENIVLAAAPLSGRVQRYKAGNVIYIYPVASPSLEIQTEVTPDIG